MFLIGHSCWFFLTLTWDRSFKRQYQVVWLLIGWCVRMTKETYSMCTSRKTNQDEVMVGVLKELLLKFKQVCVGFTTC